MSGNPFDYFNAINETKEDLTADEAGERGYNAFLTNRGLSYFRDSVAFANEMNKLHFMDRRMQFLFLINTLAPRKRRSKWFKAEKQDDVDLVKEYYCYSTKKAIEALAILSPEQLEYIKEKLYKGGRNEKQ
jgi:hypothetical protein